MAEIIKVDFSTTQVDLWELNRTGTMEIIMNKMETDLWELNITGTVGIIMNKMETELLMGDNMLECFFFTTDKS